MYLMSFIHHLFSLLVHHFYYLLMKYYFLINNHNHKNNYYKYDTTYHVIQNTGAHTQTIEGGIWRWCKEDYKKVNGYTPDMLSLWLMQWCFRRNFLNRQDKRYNFHIVCQAISKYVPQAKQFVSD